jgi:hypothetical protein
MNLRLLLISVGVLFGAVVLLCLGGLGEIELATASQCGANYLCDTPQTVDARPKLDYSALVREERRIGLR